MKNIKEGVKKLIKWTRALPSKKQHVEFVTAVLSVPVMLTVVIINLNNLNQQKNSSQKLNPAATAVPIQIVITGVENKISSVPIQQSASPSNTPIPSTPTCIKEVGQVSILSPRENEVVSVDPVCISLSTQENYCPVTWMYRLDDGAWSDRMDKNVCLHNLTNGTKIIQFKIQSTTSTDTTTLQRSFIYAGNKESSPSPTIATDSATL